MAGNVRPPERLVGRADEPSLQLRLPFMIADIRAVLRCRTSLPRLIVSSLVCEARHTYPEEPRYLPFSRHGQIPRLHRPISPPLLPRTSPWSSSLTSKHSYSSCIITPPCERSSMNQSIGIPTRKREVISPTGTRMALFYSSDAPKKPRQKAMQTRASYLQPERQSQLRRALLQPGGRHDEPTPRHPAPLPTSRLLVSPLVLRLTPCLLRRHTVHHERRFPGARCLHQRHFPGPMPATLLCRSRCAPPPLLFLLHRPRRLRPRLAAPLLHDYCAFFFVQPAQTKYTA